MSIDIKAKLIVGYRFSDLCFVDEFGVKFVTEELREKVASQFDDKLICPADVTPDFISLMADLDFMEMPSENDAIIGKVIDCIDVGNVDSSIRSFHEIEMRKIEVCEKFNLIDPEINSKIKFKIAFAFSEIGVGAV